MADHSKPMHACAPQSALHAQHGRAPTSVSSALSRACIGAGRGGGGRFHATWAGTMPGQEGMPAAQARTVSIRT